MTRETQFTLGSFFDGIGGFPYAASFYGIRSLWASEIMPECISITHHYFPHMAHVGDITRLHGGKLPPVDIVTFGSPCQGLSMAGQRRGLADERSGLFMEAIRIIDEMREATNGQYPKFAIWENVPGATSSGAGRDYQAVLSAFTKGKVPMPRSGKWANAGMVRGGGVDLAWCVYDAQYFGTAQRRRRLFLVCDFTGKRAGEVLFVPKSLRGYFEAGGTPRQGLAAFAESRPDTAGGEIVVLNDQGGASLTVERSGLSPTLQPDPRQSAGGGRWLRLTADHQQDQPLHPAARPAHPMRNGTAPCADDGDGAGQRGSAGRHRPHPQLQP